VEILVVMRGLLVEAGYCFIFTVFVNVKDQELGGWGAGSVEAFVGVRDNRGLVKLSQNPPSFRAEMNGA